MLIVEGADNLGKTTACKRLVELADERRFLPAYYAHMGRPPARFDFKYDYRDRISFFAVQDRFHLGSLVWHKNVMHPHKMKFIQEELKKFGSITVIFYTTNPIWYRKKLDERQEMFSTDLIVRSNSLYSLMATSGKLYDCEVDVDFTIPIHQDSEGVKYPDDKILNSILDTWEQRLEQPHVRKRIAKMYR